MHARKLNKSIEMKGATQKAIEINYFIELNKYIKIL